MAASNTRECFTECIGRRIVGVLFDLPTLEYTTDSPDEHTSTIIFDDGTGLTIGLNGSYWRLSAERVASAIDHHRRHLAVIEAEIRAVLATAGALGMERNHGGPGTGVADGVGR